MKSIFGSEQDHLSFMTKFMAKKCSRSAVNIEVLAMLSNDLSNKRCSWLSCGHDVVETIGGKVVGWMHDAFLLVKPGLPATCWDGYFSGFCTILIKNGIISYCLLKTELKSTKLI